MTQHEQRIVQANANLLGGIDDAESEVSEAFLAPPPSKSPGRLKSSAWQPNLGPIGTQVLLNRESKAKFLYGERGSLKTGIALHDLILHCYQDYDPKKVPPLAVICSIVRSAATEGGSWEKLFNLYLPEWFDGIGLEFTEPKQDDAKNRYAFIGTKYGHWARVVLKSIPFGSSIRGRLKGTEPSYFFFDEITDTDSPDYFMLPTQQLRRPTGGPRQYTCAGNPPDSGEEHWTWKTMAQRIGEDGKPANPTIPSGGGRLTGTPKDIAVYHVPIAENVYWSASEKREYQTTLLHEARFDPTAEDRLVRGIWTARTSGAGLFKEWFVPALHIRGKAKEGIGLKPTPGFPVIIGYDLGPMWPSITFEQLIPTRKRPVWVVFDELDYHGVKVLYKKLAWEVIEKMRHWKRLTGFDFKYMHITDESAVNQWRAGGEGSYDAYDFEKEYNRVMKEFNEQEMRLIGCPKGKGSVASRVRMLQTKLHQEELYVSATCPNTREMLLYLEDDPKDPGTPKRSKHIHKFDSLTYPMHKLEMSGGTNFFLHTADVAPRLIHVGV
jgi:hypothetical protein